MEVPDDWWREACEAVNHPMACVAESNHFVWVNSAFEKLVGYSRSELRERTWLEITVQEDVGGDLASVTAVADGTDAQYSLTKRYKHKLGKVIPIQLTVWRFPRSREAQLLCFIVEAVPETATQVELQELREQLQDGIANLEVRWRLLEQQGKQGVQVNYQNADRGGSNQANRANSATVLIVAAATMAIVVVSFVALVMGGYLNVNTPQGAVGVGAGPAPAQQQQPAGNP